MHCMKNSTSKKAMLNMLGKELNQDIATLCSFERKEISPLYNGSKDNMMNFNFGSVLNELEKKAPTMVSILDLVLKLRRQGAIVIR